jgi:hypothetical protein
MVKGVTVSGTGGIMEVQGKFDVELFWKTMAIILSNKTNTKITVEVTRENGPGEKKIVEATNSGRECSA